MNKKGMELQELAYWLLGVLVLVIILGAIGIVIFKWDSTLGYIKDLFRFKR
ncbi:MAG: hypothetical protein WC867_06845 [Candidatus Pacearchaeota archaeon]|jgi:hypothetical protein